MKKIQNLKFRNRQGFTIIEMLAVIMVVGILAATLVPSILNYLPTVKLNGSSRNLTTDLRNAQEQAITSQNQYLVRFVPSNIPPSYSLIQIKDGVETVIRQEQLPSDETLTLEGSITNNQIVFSPDGGPSSSGNITISLNGKSKIISVSPAGFVKLQ